MSYIKKKYICVRCDFTSTNRYNFEKHLNRKTLCKNKNKFDFNYNFLLNKLNKGDYIEFYESLKNKKQCPFCKKISFNSNHKRHILKCKKNPENIEEETSLTLQQDEKCTQVINNIQNNNIQNNNNNIHIHINGFNNEDLTKIDFDKLLLLNKDEFNNSTLKDKANNHAHNILSILSDVINEPSNKNFRLVNKKEKKFLIKNQEDNTDFTNLDYVNNHFYYLVNDTYKDYVSDIQHYERFLNLIDIELNEFEKGNKTKEATQYYSFIKKLKKFIKEKIFWTAEEDKRNNAKPF